MVPNPNTKARGSPLENLTASDRLGLRRVLTGQEVDLGQLSAFARPYVVSSNGHTQTEMLEAQLAVMPPAERQEWVDGLHKIDPEQASVGWPEPEDRGLATRSVLGDQAYVDDTIRPGRIAVWAGEEGSGKSYTASGELAIRVAVAGGKLADTWSILKTGGVLVVSEMHEDDEYEREETILESLGLERSDLQGRLYRLPLMTAANGKPPLSDPDWCEWVTSWCRNHGIILMLVDTATAATDADPWGRDMQAVFRVLRGILAGAPEMAIVPVVHCKKPTGHGARRISDVIGEWGRWCDVVILQEEDGPDRSKLSTYKRVRRQRRIVATQRGGLLVEPHEVGGQTGPKVDQQRVVDLVMATPGLTVADLAEQLDVSKRTASGYAKTAEKAGGIVQVAGQPRGTIRLYPNEALP